MPAPTPKGSKSIAQGAAQRNPGWMIASDGSAPTGRYSRRAGITPFQGYGASSPRKPRVALRFTLGYGIAHFGATLASGPAQRRA
jgi:hypothetical protein